VISVLMLAAAPAFAETPDTFARALLEQTQAPLLFMCSPAGRLTDGVTTLMDKAAEQGTEPDPQMDRVRAMLTPESLARHGVDRDGVVAAWGDSDGGYVHLPVGGSPEMQRSFVAEMFPDQEIIGPPPWSVSNGEGQTITFGAHTVAGVDGLVIQSPPSEAVSVSGEPQPGLVDGLATTPGGCLLYTVGIPDNERLARADSFRDKFSGFAMWIPFGEGGLVVRFKSNEASGLPLSGPVTPPVAATSQQQPVMVANLGVELLPLVFSPDAPWHDEMPEDMDPDDILRRVSVPGGATLAAFALDKDSPQMAAVVPLAHPDGQPMSARKIRRMLKKISDGDDLEWQSKESFSFRANDKQGWGAVDDGRLLLAATPEVRDDLASGTGTAWFDAGARQRASAWPLYAELNVPMLPEAPVAVGMSSAPETGIVTIGVEVPGTSFRELAESGMERLGGAMGQLSESLLSNTALLQMGILCSAVEAGPRDLPEAEALASLGIEPDGGVRYWGTVEGGGAVIHGELDADGDGEVVRYRMACGIDEAPVRLSD